jgi:hypothetical protein
LGEVKAFGFTGEGGDVNAIDFDTHGRSPLNDEGLMKLQDAGDGKKRLCRRNPFCALFGLDSMNGAGGGESSATIRN